MKKSIYRIVLHDKIRKVINSCTNFTHLASCKNWIESIPFLLEEEKIFYLELLKRCEKDFLHKIEMIHGHPELYDKTRIVKINLND